MCTVTFIPLEEKGYLLTSNRDEKTTRPASTPPVIDRKKDYAVLYPKDPKGGGTWIAADDRNRAVCLLNGAFKVHRPQYPYRHSRGLVVLDFFEFENMYDFVDLYDLNNIESFTMVIIHSYNLYEFRWDGENKYLKDLSWDKPHIWSSVTLYDEEIIKKREKWFGEWLEQGHEPTIDSVLDFHLFAGEGNKQTDVLMERNDGLKTISVTSLFNRQEHSIMHYRDIIRDLKEKVKINTAKAG